MSSKTRKQPSVLRKKFYGRRSDRTRKMKIEVMGCGRGSDDISDGTYMVMVLIGRIVGDTVDSPAFTLFDEGWRSTPSCWSFLYANRPKPQAKRGGEWGHYETIIVNIKNIYSFSIFLVALISRVAFSLLCSRTRYASTWFAYVDSLAFGFSLTVWPHDFYLSRINNQEGHWVYCWCRWVERTV